MSVHNSENIEPPKKLQRLLQWFCNDELLEAIEGDLYQAYQDISRSKGVKKANRWYFQNVLKFLKPHFMQKLKNTQDFVPKFGNYFKVAIRNYGRHKLVAGINLIGLTLGLMVMVLSGEYLRHQLTGDQYMSGSDKIFRIVHNYRSQTYSNLPFTEYFNTSRSGQLANVKVFEEIPEIEEVAQFNVSNSDIMGRGFFVEANNKKLPGGPILYTNTPEALQNIFQWDFLEGGLYQPQAEGVIISDKTARRYYGENFSGVVGSKLLIDQKPYLIRGIVEHIPENAHFDFNLIAMVDSIPYSWGAYTYAKLKPTATEIKSLNQKITEASYINDPEAKNDPLEKGLELQPLKEIHLGSNHLYELETNVKPIYIYLFAAIGFIVLVITITNYVNLAVAINANRLKEVGVRKVIGARKKDVFIQFIFESILSTCFAMVFAMLLVYLALPYFNNLLDVNLSWASISAIDNLAQYLGLGLLVGLLSGFYPSAVLSSKTLLNLLSKKAKVGTGKVSLRKVLLGFQFFLLVLMAGFAFYVNAQLDYVTEQDLGFQKEGVLTVDLQGADRFKAFKDRLLKNPNILEVGSGGTPGNNTFNTVTYQFEGVDEIFDDANQIYMDYNSAKIFGLSSDAFDLLEEGKTQVYVLNEAAGRKYERVTGKSKSSLVGSLLIEEPDYVAEDGTVGISNPIDGFVKDFHYFSKKESFNPLLISVFNEIPWVYGANIKVNTAALAESMAAIEDAYYEVEKERPLNAQFMDQRLENLYKEEFKVAYIVKILSVLSVILAMAGLIGLTYYTVKLKQREVAIRKVLGAGSAQILGLISKDFLWVGLIGLIVALPITLYAVNNWLQNFAFHIESQWWVLVLIGFVGLAVMLMGVVSQSFKTVRMNLVEPLKQE